MVRKSEKLFSLPPQVTGQTELARLLRELEALEESLIGEKGKAAAPAKISALLNLVATTNGYKLSQSPDRRQIAEALAKIRDHAPTLHISFATEPPPKVTETILSWLRVNVHRYTLLQVGLQPAIAAGCVLRTPNKIFDLSLKSALQKQKPYLLQLVRSALSNRAVKETGSK